MLSRNQTLCTATSEFVDCREAALHVLSIALGNKLGSENSDATNTHLTVQDDTPIQNSLDDVHPLLAQWLPLSIPSSTSSHPQGVQAVDLHQRVLQQAQTQLQALHCFTQLCTNCVGRATKLPAQCTEQKHQWHLLAQHLHIFDTYVSQLHFTAADAVPTDKPNQTHRRVQTQLRGEVHTLSFTLNDEDEAGLNIEDATAIQPDLLALTRATGEADRQG